MVLSSPRGMAKKIPMLLLAAKILETAMAVLWENEVQIHFFKFRGDFQTNPDVLNIIDSD